MVITDSIARRFDRAAKTYDDAATVQRDVAVALVQAIPETIAPRRIADFGAGTGFAAEALLSRYPEATVDALDLAPAMVSAGSRRVRSERIRWHVGDARRAALDDRFDLIVSSSAVQWMVPLGETLGHWRTLCRVPGYAAIATMVSGTLGEVHRVRSEVAPTKPLSARLLTPQELVLAVEAAGFTVERCELRSFEQRAASARELFRGLHAQGITAGDLSHGERPLTRLELERLYAEYERRHGDEHGVKVTYSVLFVYAAMLRSDGEPRCGA